MLSEQHRVIGFNPRSRVGSDQGIKWGHINEKVSIHAPAWGATALLSIGLLSAFKHFFPLTNK